MACTIIDLDTLIIYSLIDFTKKGYKINYDRVLTLNDLKTIVNRVANKTCRYIYSDITEENFSKTLKENSNFIENKSLDGNSVGLVNGCSIPMKWYGFGYDPEILKAISEQAKNVSYEKI